MSQIVDAWVERLKGKLPPIGDMTHWERLAAARDSPVQFGRIRVL